MPIYALIVSDPAGRREALRAEREASLAREFPAMTSETRRQRADELVDAVEQNELHTVASEACPLGLPNCRDCGDPAFSSVCRAQGHCPDCGTKHGIAPRSHLARVGLALEPLPTPPAVDEQWDRQTKRFVKRPPVDGA